MTFPMQKPSGFVDVHSEVTPTMMTNIDLWLSRAVDGTAGGTWAGVNTWQGAQTFTGAVTLSGVTLVDGASITLGGASTAVYAPKVIQLQSTSGGIAYRAFSNTLGDANANVTVAYDVWRMTTAPNTADKTYTLRHSAPDPVPIAGQRVTIVFAEIDIIAPADALVKREDGTLLATFDGSDAATGWAEFQYTAGGWSLIKWGGAVDAAGDPMP